MLRLREELLQRQDLLAVAQRALREQADLGERVEHDARRLDRGRPPSSMALMVCPSSTSEG